MTCMNTDFSTTSDVIVQPVFCGKRLRTMNTFSCIATNMGLLGGISLTASLAPVALTFKRFVLVTCVICYCMVTLDSTCASIVSFSNLCCISSIKQNVLGRVYTGLDPFGTGTKLVRISLVFTRDLVDPVRIGPAIWYQMGPLMKLILCGTLPF